MKQSFLIFALGVILLSILQCSVQGVDPSFTDCRPHIDKTIRKLAAKAVEAGQAPLEDEEPVHDDVAAPAVKEVPESAPKVSEAKIQSKATDDAQHSKKRREVQSEDEPIEPSPIASKKERKVDHEPSKPPKAREDEKRVVKDDRKEKSSTRFTASPPKYVKERTEKPKSTKEKRITRDRSYSHSPSPPPKQAPKAIQIKSKLGIFDRFIDLMFGLPKGSRDPKFATPWPTHPEFKKEPKPKSQIPEKKIDSPGIFKRAMNSFVSVVFGLSKGTRDPKFAEPWQTHAEMIKKPKETPKVSEPKTGIFSKLANNFVGLVFGKVSTSRDPKYSQPWQTHKEHIKEKPTKKETSKPKEGYSPSIFGRGFNRFVSLFFEMPKQFQRDPKWAQPWQTHEEHKKKPKAESEPKKVEKGRPSLFSGLVNKFVYTIFGSQSQTRDSKWKEPWQTHKEFIKKESASKTAAPAPVRKEGGIFSKLANSFVKLVFGSIATTRDAKWAQPWQTHKEFVKPKKIGAKESKPTPVQMPNVKKVPTESPESDRPKRSPPTPVKPAPIPDKPARAPTPVKPARAPTPPVKPARAATPVAPIRTATPTKSARPPTPDVQPQKYRSHTPSPPKAATPTPKKTESAHEPPTRKPSAHEKSPSPQRPKEVIREASPDMPTFHSHGDKRPSVEKAAPKYRETEATKATKKPEALEDDEQITLKPSGFRSREHIHSILGLDGVSQRVDPITESTLQDLKTICENAVKPLETIYKYQDISNRHLSEAEIFGTPLVLMLGPYSTGKSTFINYLLGIEYTKKALKSGAPPSHGVFRIVQYGEQDRDLDGTDISGHWSFMSLQKFGQNFVDQIKGKALNSPLLKKITFVEAPGILEMRRSGERLYPFNDVVQWFIDRADLILVMFDYTKLDAGYEMEAILDQLKGREAQTRILLNKADQVPPEELIKVQGSLFWNLSPLLSVSAPPMVYAGSFTSSPYRPMSPAKLFQAQEEALLHDLAKAINSRVDNRIGITRRHAVRVRNHAQMVDTYLNTFYRNKGFLTSKHKLAEDIINNPHSYNIYEGMSLLTNISRYDLPDSDVYRDFFRLHNLYEFRTLKETCTYVNGCPLEKIDAAISTKLPDLILKYRKLMDAASPGEQLPHPKIDPSLGDSRMAHVHSKTL